MIDLREATEIESSRGPILNRSAVRAADGTFFWIEEAHESSGYEASDASKSERLRTLPNIAPALAVGERTFLYGPLESCDLAVSHLTTGLLRGLGATLRMFHMLPLDAGLPPRGKMIDAIAEAVADPALAAAHPLLTRLARHAVRRVMSGEERVLLHGRYSTGAVVVAGHGFAIMSGIDLWSGPAEFDAGYLLGELVELSLADRSIDRDALIGSFLRGYGTPLDPANLCAFIALRTIDHAIRISRRDDVDPRLVSRVRRDVELSILAVGDVISASQSEARS